MTRPSGAIGGVSDSALAARGIAFGAPLIRPALFTYTRSLFPFDFWRDATGRVRSNFTRQAFCPTPDVTPWLAVTTYYVDINQANDTGDGLSWATAKKSINAAITTGNGQANPYIVYVRAGTYPRGNCPSGSAGTVIANKACSLIAVGGRVVTGFFDALAWTLDQGTTYRATRAGSRRAIRLDTVDQDGLFPDYTWVVDLATCRATPGSWYTDNTTTYVNRADGAAVNDANTRILLTVGSTSPLPMTTSGNMYVSGFDFSGNTPCILFGNAGGRFVAEDCTFRYSAGDDGIIVGTTGLRNGVSMGNIEAAAFIRCDASANQVDGFNSHASSGTQAFVFTMDCTGFNNGRPRAQSCNAFTTHDGGKWIDLRGIAARNAGGQVAIVQDGTAMWCIDTLCYDSRGDQIYGGTVPPSDFLVDQGSVGGCKLFLENCAAATSQYSLNVRYGAIYTRGGKFPVGRYVGNGGVVTPLS